MEKREIPSEQWPSFLDAFGRLHHGKEARITLTDASVGTASHSSQQTLLGLIDERHGREDETITLMLGAIPHGTSSHSLSRPQSVSVSEWNDTYSAKLEIDSSEGQRLVIQVGPAEQMLPPGVVTDGILLEKPS
jgi:hypothetical protein